MYTPVGIISTDPIRRAGLESAFEDHDSIIIVDGDHEALLADNSLGYLILDVSYSSTWMELQSMIRRLRPDIRLLVLGPADDEELILNLIVAGARGYVDSNSGPFAVRQ